MSDGSVIEARLREDGAVNVVEGNHPFVVVVFPVGDNEQIRIEMKPEHLYGVGLTMALVAKELKG
ncbi:hypothetical protein LCGC14_1083890 [marine sediment metagenome]|uniref:Uncharacterized protein n=1 Tax=marine sediment metagenome TaxID=412755 RepID=A0A0F9QKG5_9ZZZZ